MKNQEDTGYCLPGLTARQSQRIRTLIRTALAERGLEAVVYADHVMTADGRSWGLHTLGSICHSSGYGEAGWQSVVNRYVDDMLAKFPEEPKPLTPDQIREGVHLRLVLLDRERSTWYRYAREIGGGFHELLVHKDGDFVRWINDKELVGVDIDEMRELGRDRLREIVVDECQYLTGNGAEAYILHGDSGFIASKLLLLPELLRRYGGRKTAWPDGMFVAIPSRHRLAFAPLDAAAADNLRAIATLASYDHAHDHAPISSAVYWWKDERLHPLFDAASPGLNAFQGIPDEFWSAWERNLRAADEDVA